jgi:HTH-type transcriptional regulator/antitoxin HigA
MAKVSEKYMELIRAFPLRPICTDLELDRAIKAVDRLTDRGVDRLTADETAYLDVLSDLVEKYENKHHAIEESTPAQVLAFLIEDRNITQKVVAAATGIPVSTISELISEKRTLTMNHVERLSAYFKVSPAVFVSVKTRDFSAA